MATQARIAGIPPVRAMSWPNNVAPPKKGVVNVRAVGVGRDDSVDGPPPIPERGVASEQRPPPSGYVCHEVRSFQELLIVLIIMASNFQ